MFVLKDCPYVFQASGEKTGNLKTHKVDCKIAARVFCVAKV